MAVWRGVEIAPPREMRDIINIVIHLVSMSADHIVWCRFISVAQHLYAMNMFE